MPLYIDIGDQLSAFGHRNITQKTFEVKRLFNLVPDEDGNTVNRKRGQQSDHSQDETGEMEVEADINFSVRNLNKYEQKGLYGMTDDRIYDPNVVALRDSPPSRMRDRHLLPSDHEFKAERDYINYINNLMQPQEARNKIHSRVTTVGSKVKRDKGTVQRFGGITKGKGPHFTWIKDVTTERHGTSELGSPWREQKHESDSRKISHQYCDALGPDTCSECSSYNMRRKCHRAMKSRFPEIQTSSMNLVALRYAELFRDKQLTHCRYCDKKSIPSVIDHSANTYRKRARPENGRPSRFGDLDIVHQRRSRPRDIHPTLETSDALRHEKEKTLPYIKYKRNNEVIALPNANMNEKSFLSGRKSSTGRGRSFISCNENVKRQSIGL